LTRYKPDNIQQIKERRKNMAANDYVKGMIVGGMIGAAAGILFAPKSGSETREHIRNSAEEILEKTKKQYEEAREKILKATGREKLLNARDAGEGEHSAI
jgi:gas vesicle protein